MGFNSKVHWFLKDAGLSDRKAGEINIVVVTKTNLVDYPDVLFGELWVRQAIKRTQSKNHKLGTYKINKISF